MDTLRSKNPQRDSVTLSISLEREFSQTTPWAHCFDQCTCRDAQAKASEVRRMIFHGIPVFISRGKCVGELLDDNVLLWVRRLSFRQQKRSFQAKHTRPKDYCQIPFRAYLL